MHERMTINGMPIKDLKEVQDVLAAFQILNITTETLIEELSKQAEDYRAITTSFDSNHAVHGDILGALTEEQMKLQQLTSVIDKMSLATAHTAKEMLNMFQSDLQAKINKAFDRVDDTAVHQSLQQTIEKSLSRINTEAIDNAAKSMNTGSAKIDKLDQIATRTLNEIAGSVKEFNETVVNGFNKKAFIATGSITLLFGLILGTVGHSAIVNKNFIFWTVDLNHRYFNDSDENHYIRFTNEEAINNIDGKDKKYFFVKINDVKY